MRPGRLVILLSLFGLLPHPAGAAETDQVTMRVEVYGVAGLHVLTNRITVDEISGRYRIVSDIETRGMAGVFVDLRSRSISQGQLTGNRVVPRSFRGDSVRNGTARHNYVDYAANGTVTGGVTPPDPKVHTPVTAAQMQGTVDQLTAYLMVERQLARQGTCNLAVPVFDGRRRYDMDFTDDGTAVLQGSEHRYAGMTRVCRMTRHAIAGFGGDADDDEGARSGRIWFARLMAGDLLVPVRMQFASEFGDVTGYLVELHGRGVNLAYRE